MTEENEIFDILKFYMFKKVLYRPCIELNRRDENRFVEFCGITTDGKLARIKRDKFRDSYELDHLYPILKTSNQLTDEDTVKVYGTKWVIIDEFFNLKSLDLKKILLLIKQNYGAIPNDDSYTGYVDIISLLLGVNRPCLTFNQVENGVSFSDLHKLNIEKKSILKKIRLDGGGNSNK